MSHQGSQLSILVVGVILLAGPISRVQADTQALPSTEASEPSVSAISLDLSATLSMLSRTFLAEQRLLRDMIASRQNLGWTEAQMTGWQQQNRARFKAQLNRGRLLEAYQNLQPTEYISEVEIPGDASPTLEAFLVTKAELSNCQARIHNDWVSLQGDAVTVEQNQDQLKIEVETFQRENVGALAMQLKRAKELSEIDAHRPIEVFAPTPIPDGASPTFQAFMTLKNALKEEEIAVHNHYCGGSLLQLHAALNQWQIENADRSNQLLRLARQLSQETSDQEP